MQEQEKGNFLSTSARESPLTYGNKRKVCNSLLNVPNNFITPSCQESSRACAYPVNKCHIKIWIMIKWIFQYNCLKNQNSGCKPAILTLASCTVYHCWLLHMRFGEFNQIFTFLLRLLKKKIHISMAFQRCKVDNQEFRWWYHIEKFTLKSAYLMKSTLKKNLKWRSIKFITRRYSKSKLLNAHRTC